MTGELNEQFDMSDKKKTVSPAHEDERKIFVGGLPNEAKHDDLKTHFSQFGAVEKVKLMSDQATGRFKGFGFVVFEDVAGFDAALQKPDQTVLGKPVTCKRATVKVKQGKIYIGKLPTEGCTEEDIREHFSQFGTVVEVVRPVDKAKNDEPKPYAFVTFAREDVSRSLVKLGGDVMQGVKFNIKPVITKTPEQQAAGGVGGLMGRGGPGPHPPGLGPLPPGQGPLITPPAWANPAAAYGAGAYGGYNQAAAAYQGYGSQAAASYSGYHQASSSYSAAGAGGLGSQGYYSSPVTPGAPPPPPAGPAPGAGVPSLATFNPYDISSYGAAGLAGGGKMRPGLQGSLGGPTRPQPY